LPPGTTGVWDGRVELRAGVEGVRVLPLAGHAARLPPAARAAVLAAPAAIRPALPLVIHADGRMDCPTLLASALVRARPLSLNRLVAARGCVRHEADLVGASRL
jgi:hypothetical protein